MDENYRLSIFEELPNYRLSEEANRDRCRKCYSSTWVLLDRNGFRTELDTTRLNLADEVDAVLGGLRTYELTRQRDSFVIDRRSALRISGASGRPVLATHRCSSVAVTVWPNYWPKYVYAESEGIPF